MLRYKILYAIICLSTLFAFIWAADSQFLVIFVFLIALIGLINIFEYLGARGIKADINIQSECRIKQSIPIQVTIKKNNPILCGKIRMDIKCKNIMFGDERIISTFLELGGNKYYEYEIPFESENCGKHIFSIENIVCYDIFMLTAKRVVSNHSLNCIVYPRSVEVNAELERRPMTRNSGELYEINGKRNDGYETFDIRDYREGDSVRAIHWKLSSKVDNLVVREFSQPANFDTLILMDAAKTSQGNQVDDELINNVICMTAAISDDLLKKGIGHNVGHLQDDEFINSSIDKPQAFYDMLSRMMSSELQEKSEKTIEGFVGLQLYNQFTKVILVTGYINEISQSRLAEYTEISIVYICKDGNISSDSSNGYSITSIPSSKIGNKVQTISL